MSAVEWTDDLSVGIESIDNQHKTLIDHLNKLDDAVRNSVGPTEITETLGFLISYTDVHFSTEEKNMAIHNYPERDDHHEKHEEFKKMLFELEQDYEEEGATNPLAEALDTLLFNWLAGHIKGTDRQFSAFLKKGNMNFSE